MHEAQIQARQRFDRIWEQSQKALSVGKIEPAKMANGQTVPIDYCLSTISRIIKQRSAPLDAIKSVTDALQTIAPNDFHYGLDSLHISLIGCSPRKPTKNEFNTDKIARINTLIAETLPEKAIIQMQLCGLNLIGNQVFIQVLPIDRQWENLREKLDKYLTAHHETPISYSDKSPIHLNIMRIISTDLQKLKRLNSFLLAHRNHDFGIMEITSIEYVMTDFVVSDIEVFETFNLNTMLND